MKNLLIVKIVYCLLLAAAAAPSYIATRAFIFLASVLRVRHAISTSGPCTSGILRLIAGSYLCLLFLSIVLAALVCSMLSG